MKKIGFSIGALQSRYGDREALAIAKRIGADAVDFSLDKKDNDYRIEGSIYSKSDAEIVAYFTEIGAYARELGLIISQTHGKLTGFLNKKEEEIRLYRIMDLTLKRPLGQRLWGLGTVHCCTADKSTPEFEIKRIKDSRNFKELLSDLIEQQREEKRISGREFMMDTDGDGFDDSEHDEM
jgi:hypothetical protein